MGIGGLCLLVLTISAIATAPSAVLVAIKCREGNISRVSGCHSSSSTFSVHTVSLDSLCGWVSSNFRKNLTLVLPSQIIQSKSPLRDFSDDFQSISQSLCPLVSLLRAPCFFVPIPHPSTLTFRLRGWTTQKGIKFFGQEFAQTPRRSIKKKVQLRRRMGGYLLNTGVQCLTWQFILFTICWILILIKIFIFLKGQFC